MDRIVIGPDRRSFHRSGKPWFYLADTAWSGITNPSDDEWERYLDHRAEQGFTATEVRRAAWQGVLAGAHAGVTYGAHGIWSWHRPGLGFGSAAFSGTPFAWEDALHFEGADDYAFLRRLALDLFPEGRPQRRLAARGETLMKTAERRWRIAHDVWANAAKELDRLGEEISAWTFSRCVDTLAGCRGRIVASGCGTSAMAARKIAHSLSCIERPAFFLNPSDAGHGALGSVQPGGAVGARLRAERTPSGGGEPEGGSDG